MDAGKIMWSMYENPEEKFEDMSMDLSLIHICPGNTPVIIDSTADIKLAVNSIIHSKTFDNGMICASEQSVTVLADIYDAVKAEFKARGCYFLKGEELDKVRSTVIINGSVNAKIVGQSAYTIAKIAGVEVPKSTKILIGERCV